jgi:hypothetical protein
MSRTKTALIILASGAALFTAAPGAHAANDVISEVIVPCSAGTCSMGDAGTYTVSRAANRLTVTSVAATAGWSCVTQVPSGFQTRIECLNGSTKIISQAEVKHGVTISKVRTKLV